MEAAQIFADFLSTTADVSVCQELSIKELFARGLIANFHLRASPACRHSQGLLSCLRQAGVRMFSATKDQRHKVLVIVFLFITFIKSLVPS